MPLLSYTEVVRFLQRAGFERVSQHGSHIKLRSRVNKRTVIVPAHAEVARGTLRSILLQAGLTRAEFEALRTA